jgi:hypothetical protein
MDWVSLYLRKAADVDRAVELLFRNRSSWTSNSRG